MKKIFDTIKDNLLFSGISYTEFDQMLQCLAAQMKSFKKNEIILLSGDRIDFVGIVVTGKVRIVKEDLNGNQNILTVLYPSELFAEVFACAGIDYSPVTIEAAEESQVLFFNYRNMIQTCKNACVFHHKLTENMLKILAQKNLMLNQKIEVLSKRTTREKLLCFFDLQRGGCKQFTLPFNREQLAKYLCVDRSAMSNELCKMRDDGLIRFEKNRIQVLY